MRRAIIAGAVLAAAVVASAVLAVTAARPATADPLDPIIEVTYPDDIYRVQCNGDSFPFDARVTSADGTPLAGVPVDSHDSSGRVVTHHTDADGGVHDRITPPVDYGYPKEWFGAVASVGTASISRIPIYYSCPFPPGDYHLRLAMFVDTNRNGLREANEPPFTGEVFVGLIADSRMSTLEPRLFQLDGQGRADIPLTHGGYPGRGYWYVCLHDADFFNGYVLFAFNGTDFAPFASNCRYLPEFLTGSLDASFAIARNHVALDPAALIAPPLQPQASAEGAPAGAAAHARSRLARCNAGQSKKPSAVASFRRYASVTPKSPDRCARTAWYNDVVVARQ
jgi:hypothetical protein